MGWLRQFLTIAAMHAGWVNRVPRRGCAAGHRISHTLGFVNLPGDRSSPVTLRRCTYRLLFGVSRRSEQAGSHCRLGSLFWSQCQCQLVR
jgi:hypothetical protein